MASDSKVPVPAPIPSLEGILQSCLDARGFVIFVGVISQRRDAQGNNLIDYHYQRVHFTLEDTKQAIKEFATAYKQDAEPKIDADLDQKS